MLALACRVELVTVSFEQELRRLWAVQVLVRLLLRLGLRRHVHIILGLRLIDFDGVCIFATEDRSSATASASAPRLWLFILCCCCHCLLLNRLLR